MIIVYTSQDGVSPMSANILRNWANEIVGEGAVEVDEDCRVTGEDETIECLARGLSGCIITDKEQ